MIKGEMKKAKEKKRHDLLQQIVAWARKYDLGDEDWVEKNFEFNNDDSLICNTSLYLDSMTEPNFPKSVKYMKDDLSLNGLISAEGLNLPKEIGGNLFLNGLISAEGLNLPKEIGGNLFLNGLISAEGLNLPKKIGGDLSLNGLISAESLSLPDEIKWSLYLNSLISAEGLKLSKKIGGGVFLDGLISAEGLDLTNIGFGGVVYLRKLPNKEKQELCKKYPNLWIY